MDTERELPGNWKAVTDEAADRELQAELRQRRAEYPDVALTIIQELKREVGSAHRLYGMECTLIAWNSCGGQDYLFETSDEKAPIAMVHLTWAVERGSFSPYTLVYPDVASFTAHFSRKAR